MKMKQVRLRKLEDITVPAYTYLTCWLPVDGRIKPRSFLTLEIDGFEGKWEVLCVYKQIVEKDQLWKPWKVGGMQ